MKNFFLLVLIALINKTIVAQETFPVNGVFNKSHTTYAFINAKIVVDENQTLANGTLLIKDGIIISVGEKIEIPKGAVIADLKGKFIYPALIDAYTTYGIAEPKKATKSRALGPQMTSATKGAFDWNQAIKPEIEANKIFIYDNKSADELRKMGFGAVLTFQKDGIMRGSSAVVSLGEASENELIINDKAAAMYSFDKGSSTQDYPSSLMGAIALIRQTYLDADWYKNSKSKKEYNISLEAFNAIQSIPQIFETTDKLNALRADKIGDEFKIPFIIKGSGNEYQRLDDIKASNCKFIIPLNFPMAYAVEDAYDAKNISLTDLKHWEMAPVNPYAFEKYFIPFAITTADLKDKKDFWKNLRKAIEYGLSEKQALKSLTSTPAEMLNVSDKIGKIKVGMIANFIITSGNLFNEKTILYENWIQGNNYKINDYNIIDIRGNFDLMIANAPTINKLTIEGEIDKLKGKITKDTTNTTVTINVVGNAVSLFYNTTDSNKIVRLSGYITTDLKMIGKGQMPNGEWVNWNAIYKSELSPSIKKDSTKKEMATIGEVIYPFIGYGKPQEEHNGFDKYINNFKNRYDALLIKNITVWTNEADGILQNKDVYITEGKIVRIDNDINPSKLAFAKIIDGTGKQLTPGIIDEHSHIAISGGVNEGTHSSSAEARIGDVINSEDINIYRQLSGGVTASQLLHGSSNPIGGQAALIKLRWGKSPEAMKFEKTDGFIKFALGENVKQSNWGINNIVRFPQSRMGVEQVYYDYFIRAKEYDTKQKAFNTLSDKAKISVAPIRRNLRLEAIAEILNKKRFITCHSYVQSEINMLMHVSDSLNFHVNTFTHILEGYKVADKMKAREIAASTFADWWGYKMEVADAIPYNASILSRIGVVTAINSDDAEMGRRLNQEAAKSIKYGGMSEEDALKMITLNPAKILHVDNRVGSIKIGKEADLVIWSDNPLSIYAKAEKTIIDGQVYFDNEEDILLRKEIEKERARLIEKMLNEKKSGAKTQKPILNKKELDGCETMKLDYLNEEE